MTKVHSFWGNAVKTRNRKIWLSGSYNWSVRGGGDLKCVILGLPWSPMVKTLCAQCRGWGFNPWLGNRSCITHGMAKKKNKVCDTYMCVLSCVWFFATPWTVARQAPLSMEFPRQEYWSGLPFSSPGDLPDPGTEPVFTALQVFSSPLSFLGSPCH